MDKVHDKPKMISIRRATALDSVKIYHLFSNHMKHDCPHFDPPSPNECITSIATHCVSGLVLVADYGGKIVGAIGGHLDHAWWNGQPFFHGRMYCINPEYAEHGAGVALLKKLRTFACINQSGANHPLDIHFSLFGSNVNDEKERILSMEGFVDTGGTFVLKAQARSQEVAQERLH